MVICESSTLHEHLLCNQVHPGVLRLHGRGLEGTLVRTIERCSKFLLRGFWKE